MVEVIAGKMSWPAVTAKKDTRDFLQKSKISLTVQVRNDGIHLDNFNNMAVM